MADQNQGIAARLRAARLEQGLEIESLARELKNPRAVLESIERGDWARLGAPVFARHLVGRYAARLGVSVDLDQVVDRVEATVLRPQVSASRLGRLADFSTRNAAYVGGSLLVLPLVYLALSWTGSGPAEYRSLDPVRAVAPVASDAETIEARVADDGADVDLAPVSTSLEAVASAAPAIPADGATADGVVAAPTAPTPVTSTPATMPTPVAASLAGGLMAGAPQLELQFSGDSWIEVFDREGVALERALARRGETRRFPAADIGRVTIGNVDATSVVLDGSRVNLEAVRAANVARFALSSDGSIEAVAR